MATQQGERFDLGYTQREICRAERVLRIESRNHGLEQVPCSPLAASCEQQVPQIDGLQDICRIDLR